VLHIERSDSPSGLKEEQGGVLSSNSGGGLLLLRCIKEQGGKGQKENEKRTDVNCMDNW